LVAIVENINTVLSRIAEASRRSGRRPEEIKLVAISKTVGTEQMLEAIGAGIRALGENRVQEARSKWPIIAHQMTSRGCEFHLVGHLQRNKAKEAVRLFDLIHSLDSERLALEINKRAGEISKIQRVLIEVNTSGEASKFGIQPEEAENLINFVETCPNLKLEGLMTVGPLYGGSVGARQSFQTLRKLRDDCGGEERLPDLSMGMTQDFEEAIEEGATMIRVGTAIFGARR